MAQTLRLAATQGIERQHRTPRYASLNAVRAVLGLSVLTYHLSGTIALEKYFGFSGFDQVFGFGGARVPFFFVLSGFVLTLVYARDFGRPDKALGFLRRRFIRLYPTYWVVLLLVMSPALFFPSLRAAIPDDPWAFLQMLLLVSQDPEAGSATGAPVIVVAWTLHYEIVFCLLMAAWIWSRPLGMVLSLALVANAVIAAQGESHHYSRFLAGGSMLYFAVGAGAAWLVKRLPPLPHARAMAGLAVAAYIAVAVMAHGGIDTEGMLDPNVYYVLLAAIVLMCLVHAEAARPPVRSSRVVQLLSDSSYAMYLMHFPIISLLCKVFMYLGLTGAIGAVIAFVSIFSCCIVCAVVFHVYFERRWLAWR